MGEIRWSGVLQNATPEREPLIRWLRPDANNLAACFGKKTQARINQIEEILETLRSLGKLE